MYCYTPRSDSRTKNSSINAFLIFSNLTQYFKLFFYLCEISNIGTVELPLGKKIWVLSETS